MAELKLIQDQEQSVDVCTFDDSWAMYPKRVAKKDARNAWAKMIPAHRVAALVACLAWRPIWAAAEVEFIPHPATWLNGERWEDELPVAKAAHGSHVPAKIPDLGDHTEMPDSIRAEIKALTRKFRVAG